MSARLGSNKDNPSPRYLRTRSLLLGTQLAVVLGSLLISLLWFAIGADPDNYLDSFSIAGIIFLFLLISSFLVVNFFVFLLAIPTYFVCKPPAGRFASAIIGAFSGIVAFGILLFMIVPDYAPGMFSRETNFFRGDFGDLSPILILMFLVPSIYGALVGLFTAELESGKYAIT